MKKKRFILASSLFGLLLGAASCSSETELLQGAPEGGGSGDSGGIRIVVHTPAPDDIVSRAAAAGPTHVEQEYKVHKMGVYLFEKTGGTDADTDYKLVKKVEDIAAGGGDGQFTDSGNGNLSYTMPITADLIGKTVKIALVANDKAATADVSKGTTLDAFKKNVASAKLTANDASADVISGNIFSATQSDNATGLVMSAVAKSNDTEAFVITPLGADLTASFQRSLARIDICNNTPNLTITGLKVLNAASQAYIFPQATTAAPAEQYYSLLPTTKYNEALEGEGIAFIPGLEEDESADIKAKNTHKNVFYLYEQVNNATKSAAVKINYTLKVGNQDKPGEVTVKLMTKKDPETYVNTTRNNLYTIVIGSGKPIEDGVKVTTVEVKDWEATTDIPGDLEPGEDGDAIPGDEKPLTSAAVGDFYMSDGTLRDGATPLEEKAKPHVVGVVFQTAASNRIGEAEKQALSAKGVSAPHGLVMALKFANGGNGCKWKNTNDTDGLTFCVSKQKCYQDMSGLGNCNTVKDADPGFAQHPALKAAMDYENIMSAPKKSSGWFLPSIGQWWDIVANLGGNTKAKDPLEQSGSATGGWNWQDSESGGNAADKINEYLNKVGAPYVDAFEKGPSKYVYWTSSEYNKTAARNIHFNINGIFVNSGNRTNMHWVRAVLAF